MAVDNYDDLEPIENLLYRCEDCGAVRATYMSLRQHQGHSNCVRSETVDVEGIEHKVATEF